MGENAQPLRAEMFYFQDDTFNIVPNNLGSETHSFEVNRKYVQNWALFRLKCLEQQASYNWVNPLWVPPSR